MKKLQMKIRDLTNPTILSHHEIKNVLGGEGSGVGSGKCDGYCSKIYWDHTDTGTCSWETEILQGHSLTYCKCSAYLGTGCPT